MTQTNANGARESTGRSRWEALQRELGQRYAQRLFDDLARDPSTLAGSNSVSFSVVMAFLCAIAIYAASVALGVAGIAILMAPWGNIFTALLACILILLCWIALPRPTSLPDYPIAESQCPTLYLLARRIAEKMRAPPIAGIGISADFNANYRAAGWRMRRYIELGAPLLAILSPEERVAVIAHELSHGANGDPLRGGFLYGAVATLGNWAMSIRPSAIGSAGENISLGPFVSLIAIPFEFILLGISELLFLAMKGILLLVLRESQRAEYLADRLAATVSGSEAMRNALEKLYLAEAVDQAVHRHVLTSRDAPLGPCLREVGGNVDAEELGRLREQSVARSWQVDATHPPTALRVAMLERGAPLPAVDLLAPDEQAALDTEVAHLIASQQREIVNRKVEQIYGG